MRVLEPAVEPACPHGLHQGLPLAPHLLVHGLPHGVQRRRGLVLRRRRLGLADALLDSVRDGLLDLPDLRHGPCSHARDEAAVDQGQVVAGVALAVPRGPRAGGGPEAGAEGSWPCKGDEGRGPRRGRGRRSRAHGRLGHQEGPAASRDARRRRPGTNAQRELHERLAILRPQACRAPAGSRRRQPCGCECEAQAQEQSHRRHGLAAAG
mmetsp:Transcript_50008/g.154657  ORF Transcript_50008/g.154657 Transcript_50008/m.154657 type:complete len:209 (+) Transcript_50008:1039-1665(+)